MNKTKKITISAISAALSAAFMLLGYFPYFTYAVPAVAGLFMMIPLIEAGKGWAFSSYIVSSFLVFFIGEPETKILFIALLGYYPILKAIIEKIHNIVIEWIIKETVFNLALVVCYYVSKLVIGIGYEDLISVGKIGIVIFIVICELVFVLYDIAISRISFFYFKRIHSKINKIFK